MGKKRLVQKESPVKQAKKQKITKKVTQKIQNEKSQQSENAPILTTKNAQKKFSKFEIFSTEFYKKLDDFQGLYRDFLNSKTQISDSDIQAQMKDVTSKVSSNIQNQASLIFKNQLLELQKWIEDQITKINQEAKSIQNVYQQNRESLLKTGAFTEQEVRKQLAPIQAKAASRRQIKQKYENLLVKSKEIYE